MKKFLILFCTLACSVASAQMPKEDAVKNLANSDIKIADDARMQLEKMSAESELLSALDKTADKRLREGLIYSLGMMKSKNAYGKIRGIAFEQKDSCPAAVLALAQYNTAESSADLEKLAAQNCKTAVSALFLIKRAENPFGDCDNAQKAWRGADENAKVRILANLGAGKNAEKFLSSAKSDSEREAIAKSFALSRVGGKKNAEEIFKIAAQYNNSAFELALADCAGGDDVIAAEIAKGNTSAVRAASLRNSAGAEDALLKLLDGKPENAKPIFDALQNIGGEKTAEKFIANFPSVDANKLQYYVKTLTFAFERIDADARDKLAEKLAECAKNADAQHKLAAEKILAKFKK